MNNRINNLLKRKKDNKLLAVENIKEISKMVETEGLEKTKKILGTMKVLPIANEILPTNNSIIKDKTYKNFPSFSKDLDYKFNNEAEFRKKGENRRTKEQNNNELLKTARNTYANLGSGILGAGSKFTSYLANGLQKNKDIMDKYYSNSLLVKDSNGNIVRPGKINASPILPKYEKIQKFAEKFSREQDDVQRNRIKEINNPIGKKAVEIGAAVGNMIPGVAASLVNPILGSGAFMGTAGGGYLQEAKDRGMNDEQVHKYANIMGGVEGATEMLGVGRLLKAGKSIGKGLIKEGIKNYGIGIADNFLQEAVIEPTRETASQLISDKSDWSNMSQRMISSGVDGALVSMIMGGVSTGIGSAVNLQNKIINGEKVSTNDINKAVDDIKSSNYTKNLEMQQINKSINSKIKESKNILEDNTTKINRNNLSEIINNSNIENKQELINGLNKVNKIDDDLVYNVTSNINPSEYILSAKKYNLDTNNETVKSIDKVTNQRGIKTIYDAETFKNNNINALWKVNTDENGNLKREVIINPNADKTKTLENITIHELTHDLEGTNEYNTLKQLVLDYDSNKNGYKEARQSLENAYANVYNKDNDIFTELVDNEVVADILESKLSDQKFINNLTIKNTTVSQKVYNWVTDKLNNVNKSTGYKNEKIYWKDIKNKFENSFEREYSVNDNQTNFTIQTDNKDVKVNTNQDLFNEIETNKSKNFRVNKKIDNKTNTKSTITYPPMTEKTTNEVKLDNTFLETIGENTKANKVSYFKDVYRNMRNVFGQEQADKITGVLDKAKLNNVNMKNEYANELKTKVVDKLGIKKGSKESELVQRYGEKQITLEQLKDLAPDKWENIVEADKWFKTKYNELIDNINTSRKKIYPNVEKIIETTNQKLDDTLEEIKYIKENGLPSYKIDADIKNNIKRLENIVIEKTKTINDSKNKETMIYKKNERIINESKTRISELKNISKNRADNKLDRLKSKAKELRELLNSEEIWRGKRIPKRDNYYKHFQEMTQGFKSLHNILNAKTDISTSLAGISEFTKPNSKWLGFAQKRLTNETEYDAVAGFLNYIEPATYAINIDPLVKIFRDMNNEIITNTAETKNANKLIEYIDELANLLAGKTNMFDRPLQKVTSRKFFKSMVWLSRRIKSNMVLGNFSSSVSQILNLPQVVGTIKNPITLTKGFIDTIKGNKEQSNSQFLQERYKSDIMSQFDDRLIQQPKKLATWMIGALDEVVTKTAWNSLYIQAKQKGIRNPIQYADNITRELVAGRGIGERTLAQESIAVNTFLPFTVETGNLWRVMSDKVSKKDFGGLLIMFIVANLLDKLIDEIGASGKTFDPIQALIDAITEENLTPIERVGRIGGEILSSHPIGQQISSIYPEYGVDWGIVKLPTKDKLFGKNDPTRFGTGNIYTNIVKNPITSIITPWGGKQLEKSYKGIKAITKEGVYNSKDELKYPIGKDMINNTKGVLFGDSGFKEADLYYDNELSPMGIKKAKKFKDYDIDYEDYVELSKNKFKKKSDKIKFIGEMNISETAKFNIYKFDIFSDEERKTDKGSQIKDAEYAIKNNKVTKKEYMKIYNKAVLNNIEMPIKKELEKLKINDVKLDNYISYKIDTSEKKMPLIKNKDGSIIKNTRKVKIIDYILKSNMTDKEKSYLFSKEFTDTKSIVNSKIPIDEYLKFEKNISFLDGDKDEKSILKDKKITNSKKRKVLQEIVKLNITPQQKILLTYLSGYSIEDTDYKGITKNVARLQTFKYIEKLNIDIEEKKAILKRAGYKLRNDDKWTW